MAEPRRSTRIKNAPAPAPAPNRQTLRTGYQNFAAGETTVTTSGTTATTATLNVNGVAYVGNSGNGHAEMDALNQALAAAGNLATLIGYAGKTVSCTAKPCCYRCSIILGLLGFAPATAATLKTRSGMGSTQWVLPQALGTAIIARYGDIYEVLNNPSNFDQL